MKITILQNDADDYKKAKVQLETDFLEMREISGAVLLLVCDCNTEVAMLSSLVLAHGSPEQREQLLSGIDQRTKNEFLTLTTFLRQCFNASDVVQNRLSQPTEATKPSIG